ncbi:CaiB/BaiF CoA transferase family protein [Variovorax terrae]|uniref:CoA transferase n=1 Tax=Variovorax terrae TaxID=2923278 RepID=A0A9X2AL61_9BURK|nr:CoA transferase [Variovorax terrae]MCJ0762363.1 CoA transferase [Variovorax terrae]
MSGALEGIRVVEVSSVIMGPWAGQVLGDMGADVVKVEPLIGDVTRNMGPARHRDMASAFLNLNRNKRSIALDMSKPAGVEVIHRLLGKADVLLHNLRPKAAAKLGLEREQLLERFPRLVVCEAYGFARGGPLSEKAAYDDIIQAASGLADLQSSVMGTPRFLPTNSVDKSTAYCITTALCAALLRRERTGRGQAIEVPMFECTVDNVMIEHLHGATFDPPIGPMGSPRLLSADRRPYPTLDGFLAVLPYNDTHWKRLLEIAGRGHLWDDPRVSTHPKRIENSDWLHGVLAEIVATRTTRDWLEALNAADIPVMQINTKEALLHDEQLQASGFWHFYEHPSEGRIRRTNPPVRFSESPSSVRRVPPMLGEHTEELLQEVGFSAAQVVQMQTAGIVRCKS